MAAPVPVNDVLMAEARELLIHASSLWNVPVAKILSGDKQRRCHEPRIAVALVLARRGWYLVDIGTVIGREHSTVSVAIQRCEALMRSDPDYRYLVEALADGRSTAASRQPEEALLESMVALARDLEDVARRVVTVAQHLGAGAQQALDLHARQRAREDAVYRGFVEEAAG